MASYHYPGVLFGLVTIAGGTFAAPAELPARWRGNRLVDLARLGEIVGADDPTMVGKGFYPLVDVTVVPNGKCKKATYADALNSSTPRTVIGSVGIETVTKTIDRTFDLEDVPAELLVDPADFVGLFPAAKAAAIMDSTNVAVRQFVMAAQSRRAPINLKSATLAAKLQYLVDQNLITGAEKANIIAGTPPA